MFYKVWTAIFLSNKHKLGPFGSKGHQGPPGMIGIPGIRGLQGIAGDKGERGTIVRKYWLNIFQYNFDDF
jgi:hypothetical protein